MSLKACYLINYLFKDTPKEISLYAIIPFSHIWFHKLNVISLYLPNSTLLERSWASKSLPSLLLQTTTTLTLVNYKGSLQYYAESFMDKVSAGKEKSPCPLKMMCMVQKLWFQYLHLPLTRKSSSGNLIIKWVHRVPIS